MHITLHPIRHDHRPEITREGDALIIDGEVFDFAALPDGAKLPRAAIESPWFAGDVKRVDGVLHIALLLSHGATAPDETRIPAALDLTGDGPLPLPPYDAEAPNED